MCSVTNVLTNDSDKPTRSLCVENVGWNYQTPEDQFRAWKTSGEHNKNLLNKKITHAGIAQTGAYVTFLACTGEE